MNNFQKFNNYIYNNKDYLEDNKNNENTSRIKILITGFHGAAGYVAQDKTYAIRIGSRILMHLLFPLKDEVFNKNWLKIKQYAFNDGNPNYLRKYYNEKIPFDKDIAKEMLKDFNPYVNETETLLIHCTYGYHRSPALGMAFNEIFKLGYDKDLLKKKFPDYRKYVYETMIEAGNDLEGILNRYNPRPKTTY